MLALWSSTRSAGRSITATHSETLHVARHSQSNLTSGWLQGRARSGMVCKFLCQGESSVLTCKQRCSECFHRPWRELCRTRLLRRAEGLNELLHCPCAVRIECSVDQLLLVCCSLQHLHSTDVISRHADSALLCAPSKGVDSNVTRFRAERR